MGRYKKEGAKVAGQLNEDLCRFTFIINKKLLTDIKTDSVNKELSMKDYMNRLLTKKVKPLQKKLLTNEAKLRRFLK